MMSYSEHYAKRQPKKEHPVKKLHCIWHDPKVSASKKEEISMSDWKLKIGSYLDQNLLVDGLFCKDVFHSHRTVACTCLSEMTLAGEEREAVLDYLVNFAKLKKSDQEVLIIEWMKYSDITPDAVKKLRYLLPGSKGRIICLHALCGVIGLTQRGWKRCVRFRKEDIMPFHGLQGRRSNSALEEGCVMELASFFNDLEEFAAPRATLQVKEIVDGVAKSDLKNTSDLVELPSAYGKRHLWRKFIRSIGWDVKMDNISRVVECYPVEEGKQKCDFVSWTGFTTYWKQHFPKIIIQAKTEDVCDECYVFANQHKYKKMDKKPEEQEDDDDDDDDDDEAPLVEEEQKQEEKEDTGNLEDPTDSEALVLRAAKHVDMAVQQRKFFVDKKAQSKVDPNVLCFVADFAQNMGIPNFASDQPGAVYYYTPVNVYPFGIVDCSTDPTVLNAHIYIEGQANKGGNNVASMLWKDLKNKGIIEKKTPYTELNYVFDNCGGQNKNKMVLRLLMLLYKMKIAKKVVASFLVKGHTKNECDRMFNLMKIDYRNTNIYTPKDLFECIDSHPQVDAELMDTSEFLNFDKLEDLYMAKEVKHCSFYHVFIMDDDNPNHIVMKASIYKPDTQVQMIVKKEYQDKDAAWWRQQVAILETLEEPGLPNIKWLELYKKWGKFVPQDKKLEWVYYCEPPGTDITQEVLQQSAAARELRHKRARTETTTAAASGDGDDEPTDMTAV